MNIEEGSVIRIEGSDEYWEVIEADKDIVWIRDVKMGIIEIEVQRGEVIEVAEPDGLDLSEEAWNMTP